MPTIQRRERDQVEDPEGEVVEIGVLQDPEERDGDERRGAADPGQQPEHHQRGEGHEEVRERAGQSHHRHVPAWMAEVAGADGDRLRPSEAREHEGQRADRIDVRQRVQGEPAGQAGRRIPEPVRHDAVGHLVHGDREEKRRDLQDEGLQEGDRIAEQAAHLTPRSRERRAPCAPSPRMATDPIG